MMDSLDLIRKSLPPSGRASRRSADPSQEELEVLMAERITPERNLPPMQPLFRMFEVPCFYRGELVADCGKAKSGKTTFLSVLMAAAIGSQKVLALERTSADPLRILWVDTEQSQQSTQEIIRERIVRLVGECPDLNSRLYAFNLRGMGYEVRKRMVEVAVLHVKPDLVIIDGIKDLMTDINDAVQATLIMEQLMALAKEGKCCIVCVLHQNKSEADRNMRGSIGTELTNKAFEVFQCEVVNDRQADVVFKVTQTYSRKQKMRQRLYYRLNEQSLPELYTNYREQPREVNGRFASPSSMSEDETDLHALFEKAFEGRNQRTFNELMAVALKKCGVVDAKTYYAYVSQAEEQGIIRKQAHPDTGVTWVELLENPLPF